MKKIKLMKTLFIFFIALIPFTSVNNDSSKSYNTKKEINRCIGSSNCTACSNCSACKWCFQEGGTCGVCSSKKQTKKLSDSSSSSSKKQESHSGQCKAITKKGTRCSRAARSGGYCWQHGG